MSISASVNLRIVHLKTKNILSPVKTLEILINHGWQISHDENIFYLPLGDNDMFNWTKSKISIPSFMEILKKKEEQKELIGVAMTWQNTTIGGEILLYHAEEMKKHQIHTSMDFCLSDRKILSDFGDFKITDVNWYLERLLPVFNQGNTYVEYYEYSEHI
jgi:hypothetical protein